MTGKRLSFPIENKILYPFVCISLVAVVCFCAIMYGAEYQIKMEAEIANARALAGYINADINAGGYWADPGQLLKKYEDNYRGDSLFIYDNQGSLLFARRQPEEDEVPLWESSDNRLGWHLVCSLNRRALLDDFIEEQKYMILAAVAMLLVIVEASVLVAHNISAPIRRLSEACVTLSLDHTQPARMVDEYIGRRDEVGQLAAAFRTMTGRIRDYTEQLLQVKALNESIVENLPLGVVVYDRDGQVLLQNARAAAMLARKQERDGLDRDLELLLDGLVRREAVLPESARLLDGKGRARNYEFGVWQLRSGEDERGGILCTIDDVTYQRHMEEKITQDEKLAYAGKLAADVAHEIRNPLAGIRAGLQVVGNKLGEQRDQLLCREMVREVDRVNLLIENLLTLSRRRQSQKTAVNLNNVCQELRMLYSKVAENKDIALRVELEGKLWLHADEDELRQVLINLVNNSIRAIPGGGRVTLAGWAEESGVTMEITDTGAGMDENTLEKARRGEGGGLGLSIVQRLLEQNGGELTLESLPGEGTRAILRFHGGGEE